MIHAGQKHNLRKRLASDLAQFGREVIRLLDAVDLVACGATKLNDEFASVRNLLRVDGCPDGRLRPKSESDFACR